MQSGRGRGRRIVRPHPPNEHAQVVGASGPGLQQIENRSVICKFNDALPAKRSQDGCYLPRPGYGTTGRLIRLTANYFPVEIPDGILHHYNVEVAPQSSREHAEAIYGIDHNVKKLRALNCRLNRDVVRCMESCYPDIFNGRLTAYDGKASMYSRHPLNIPREGKRVTVVLDSGPGRFSVSLKKVAEIDLSPLRSIGKGKGIVSLEAIMALDVVLRHGPSLQLVPVGRSFFMKPKSIEEVHPLSKGREVWFGYYQSLRQAEWKLMLNINKTATAFYQSIPVIQFTKEVLKIMNGAPLTVRDYQRVKLRKELKGVKIKVTHLPYPRKFSVVDVCIESARQQTFPMQVNGRQVNKTVEDYFREQYNIVLKYPNLPCLRVGSAQRSVFLPMEVCIIAEGQPSRKKLDEVQTAEMIKKTAIPPQQRFRAIQQSVKDTVELSRPYIAEFGLRISTEPLKLEGRVLEPPHVVYEGDKRIKPVEGAWNLNGTRFFQGAEINKWILLSFVNPKFCSQNHLNHFAEMLCSTAREVDLRMQHPLAMQIISCSTNIKDLFKNLCKSHPGLKLVVCVISCKESPYAEIKHAAETQIGMMTQCVRDVNVTKKCTPALLVNLCQKINAKAGGINSSLLLQEKPSIFQRPVIIIGADVTHPAPTEKNRPSVAAAVGSVDSYPCQYAVSVRAQDGRVEDIRDLKDMVKELLKAFFRHTRYKPEKIIFYRDGVSEGQFDSVLQNEVTRIQDACSELDQEYKPFITFIVVQKRHHTRFAPQDIKDGVGRHKNIPPGTTVDKSVTHPVNFDFFLCSHFGIQGTSKPAHYTVLYDDNGFSADEMEKLTYHLCHTYVRCTRSVSIPAPVQYAHLAAFRARQHILMVTGSDSGSGGSYANGYHKEATLQDMEKAVEVRSEMKTLMYYV